MKNIFLLGIFLVLSSCYQVCEQRNEFKRQEAQAMYNSFGTSVVKNISHKKAQEMFGCYYRYGDDIYAYNTLWGKKYILARYGTAITYVDSGGLFGQ